MKTFNLHVNNKILNKKALKYILPHTISTGKQNLGQIKKKTIRIYTKILTVIFEAEN